MEGDLIGVFALACGIGAILVDNVLVIAIWFPVCSRKTAFSRNLVRPAW